MISLTHITEAELRQFYLFEGKISGRDKEINMFNEIILQSKQFLSFDIDDVLIETKFIDKNTEEIINKTNFSELNNIVSKMLEILYILVDYYIILNDKILV